MPSLPLDPSPAEVRAMGEAALDLITRFLARLPEAPASDMDGAYELVARLRGPAPEEGTPLAGLLAVIEQAAAKGFDTAGPGYLGYIPGGGLPAAAIADLVADTVNRFTNLGFPAPALVALEADALRWIADLFAYPPEAAGIFTSGGSLANFSAVVAARRALLPDDFLAGTLYTSAQAHHSVEKAAVLAGFPAANVRAVPTTPDLHVDLDALAAAVARDRAAGLTPFCMVANAGTTNTGAVDSLPDLASLCAREALWLHVDAAYGGFFQLTDRGRARLAGIERADSITLDPHKGLFLPYGTGCLLVRDGEALRRAHAAHAEYLQDLAAHPEVPDFADYSPELSRPFRGLRVWLPVKLHGWAAFRDALDEKLDLAAHAYDALAETEGIEAPWPPELSVVAFRHHAGDAATRRLLDAVNAGRRVFLSSTNIDGRLHARMAILSFRTHRDRVDEALAAVAAAAAEPGGA